ncbi:Uncharacterized protein Adt_22721 [Abeliophyllum distichum]|uniref:DUF1985 domain-containing protein n=1 Tax=Abeliophyllum distichum TaxID=126358 RepID=A0ABD1S922_9LAMI
MFRGSCFGFFLEMRRLILQPQLIHSLLLRQVQQPKDDEIWFRIGGECIRFSLDEFCLTVGLRGVGIVYISTYDSGKNLLKDTYFFGLQKVSKFELQRVFMRLNDQVSHEDVVKLAKLYLISYFLYTTSYNKSVDERHMRLVDRLECNDFVGERIFIESQLILSSLL